MGASKLVLRLLRFNGIVHQGMLALGSLVDNCFITTCIEIFVKKVAVTLGLGFGG